MKDLTRVSVHAEEITSDDPQAPKVGRWYWVQDKKERWLGCITRVGSNYALVESPTGGGDTRIHLDEFWDTCTFVEDPDTIIRENVARQQTEVHELMAKVREITARLAITGAPALPGAEVNALTVHQGKTINEYKKALVLAKEKTLPKLFEEIKTANKLLGKWMKATLIPLEAQAAALGPAIASIKHRIFSVELYAGLVENVEQIKDGEPAPATTPIHLFQRRGYCDEECVAEYKAGGIEFKTLRAFDKWFVKPENLRRLLPFPRCIMAFQVRRHERQRQVTSLAELVRMMEDAAYDRLTFLYIRNGEQVFRLNTEIDFDHKLFPDLERSKLDGKIYAKVSCGTVDDLITENEWLEMKEDEERKTREYEAEQEANSKLPDDQKTHEHFHAWIESSRYEPFDQGSVYYDDISRHIQDQITKHNRLVLVLQGLLDRSPVLHPHPPWQLWTNEGFSQALQFVYDDSRALVAGDKPNFEAYRARLNKSLKVGSVTIGQRCAWKELEAEKDRDRRHRYSQDPGPGKLARVADITGHRTKLLYTWTKPRAIRRDWDDDEKKGPLGCKLVISTEHVLNVDAYKPGDFKQFFSDPRTREEYLRWAPMLLEAEEYHAGNRKVAELATLPPRIRTRAGALAYQKRKRLRAYVGQFVRLRHELSTRGGKRYEKGSTWKVTHLSRGEFSIAGIVDNEGRDTSTECVRGVPERDIEIVPGPTPGAKKTSP